jgi:hypothetical protein
LVERLGGQLMGDANLEVTGIAPLTDAGVSHISFLSNSKLRAQARKAGGGTDRRRRRRRFYRRRLSRARASSPPIRMPISPARRSISRR